MKPGALEELEVARYGKEFKDKAVARLLPPESSAIELVSREIGISVGTLERWRAEALAQPQQQRIWTSAARFEAVLATAAMDKEIKSAWCHEHGVYPQELTAWRQSATQALAGPAEERRATPQQTKQDQRRIKELERELRRKDKALAEAAALLVLSKKVQAIFNKDKGEDE